MFFYLSKIFYFLLHPINAYVFICIIAMGLMWFNWHRSGRWLMSVSTLVLILVTAFPIGIWMRIHLEQRFPQPTSLPAQIDGILVLGGAVNPALSVDHNQLILQSTTERLFSFAALAEEYPEAKLIYSGGSGSLTKQELKEADVARVALKRLGMDTDNVIFENQSRNTFENIRLTKKLVTPKVGENWILVTSAQHMPRAMGIARAEGWQMIPYPVDYNFAKQMKLGMSLNFSQGAGNLYSGLYEFIGLAMYRLTGKIDEFYPAPAETSN